LASLAKALAAWRGRSQEAAEAMMRDSASFTASEATDKHIVEWQVDSREALLRRLHGHSPGGFVVSGLICHAQSDLWTCRLG
jgi:membrane-bound ClpP family serine protease